MAICPNCGANVGFSKVCPHCGTPIGAKAPEQTSNIEQIKQTTNNFSQKPTCGDTEFKEMVVKFLANASESEKNTYSTRVKAYSTNYKNGGTGIINNPVKSEYARSGGEASDFTTGGTTVAAATTSSKAPKPKKPLNKKTLVIVMASILGVALVVGCAVGIPLGVRAVQQRRQNARTSHITLYANYPSDYSSYSYSTYEITRQYGDKYSISGADIPSDIPGYKFIGYFDDSYYSANNLYSGYCYFDEDGYPVQSWDKDGGYYSLYAHWEKTDITIYLDANGGSGGDTSITATPGHNMPRVFNLPTRTGYTFAGYYDTTSFYGTKYIDSDGYGYRSCNFESNRTLYALWNPVSVLIELNRNGGNGGTYSINAEYGSTLPLISPPTRTGYQFEGYFTEMTGGTQYYNGYGQGIHTSDFTVSTILYAHWTQNLYTVTLNKNGGSGGTSSVQVTYDSPMPTISTPTRSGYQFLGYYSSSSGGTKYYNSNGTSARNYTSTSNMTLYAQWSTLYTVTLNKNGGSGGTNSVQVAYNESMPTITTPSRSGYVFVGYYTSTSSGTKYYNSNGTSAHSYSFNGNTTLYAIWKTAYTVTLSKNGGSGGTSSVQAAYNEEMPTIEIPTRSGYVFIGYFTSTSGGTKYYNSDGTSARVYGYSSSTTLYAHWDTGYTVTLDKNGGTGGPSTILAAYGEPMPRIEVPTKSGYKFLGYFHETSGGIRYYYNDGYSAYTYPGMVSSTLVARWSSTQTTSVTWHSARTGTYGFNESYPTSPNEFSSANYHLANSIAEQTFTFTSSGTLYYKYKVSSESSCDRLSITFNGSQIVSGMSGEENWYETSTPVNQGDTLVVRYSKDGSIDNGDDRAYFSIV